MFLISKLFWVVAQPLSLAFLAVLFALVALGAGLRRSGVALGAIACAILFVTLYTTTGSYVLQGLEARFPRPADDPQSLSCMIVLGGSFETEVTTTRGGIEMNQAADRFVEALRLARRFPQSVILVSGGDGSLSGRYEGDAVASDRFFTVFGISSDRLLRETRSRTTAENVDNSRSLLLQNGLQNCLLITSAFHMPRAVGLFRSAGLAIVPWPTDYRTSGKVRLALDFTQPTLNAQQMATAVREWTGLAAYYLMGRIGALYPAP
ncbi:MULTISPECIES: YdcF family protein [Alphaproteobacteria]|uniref:Membrane protein n=2 Tax=Alphaproteobacteria TaxID=28211 RepID=A0A512HIN3_9HYPH|nr:MULTISPECIES: YdcF family protein [Alphaproteobacteria]GEO85319.1 membrane protein [Ciceribacter naphthalenivorans]GLR20958.1 membrane protein [Ciceribacter naphthalenivorans]GLT03814.1 membrane protein [Sphingomonas psychrolutea]